MGKFSSVLIATLQSVFGICIFTKPDLSGSGPLLSAFVVLGALFLVLWTLPLYPRGLRKLVWLGDFYAQYLIAAFLIEHIMSCFWFPLEATAVGLLRKMGSALEELHKHYGLNCHLCEVLSGAVGVMFVSYFLSCSIFLAAAHATRIINLVLFSGGVSLFMHDVRRRFKRYVKNCPFNIGFPKFGPRQSERPDYCTSDDDSSELTPGEMNPLDNDEFHHAYQ